MLELGMLGGPLHKKYKIYLDRVGVAKVPENYEDRLTEIFPRTFKHLRLLALDPYDLGLSKLERNIQRDRDLASRARRSAFCRVSAKDTESREAILHVPR
jgi:hypothetical protein